MPLEVELAYDSGWEKLVTYKIGELQDRVTHDRKVISDLKTYLSCATSHEPHGESFRAEGNVLKKLFRNEVVFEVVAEPRLITVKSDQGNVKFPYTYEDGAPEAAVMTALVHMAEVMAQHKRTHD